MLIRHIIGYVPSMLIPALASFGAIFCYTRLLTPEEYGHYALALNAMTLLAAVFFYWLQTALPRLMPQAAREGRAAQMQFTTYVAYAVMASMLLLITAILLGFMPLGDWREILILAVPLTLTRALLNMNQAFHRSALDFRRYNLVECGQAVVGLTLGLALVWLGFGSRGAVLGMVLGMLCMVCVDLQFMLASKRAHFSKDALMELARFGLPLVFTYGLALITSTSDRFLIKHFYGAAEVGIYAAGYTLMDRINTILFMLVALPSLPLTVNRLEHEGIEAARWQTHRNGVVVLALAVPACIGLLITSRTLAEVMIGPEFRTGAVQVMPWIAVSALFNGLATHYFDHAFHFAKKPYLLFFTQAPTALLNLTLNLTLIPRYGYMGAAYANVISYALLLALSIGVGRRAFRVRFPFLPALQILASASLMALVLLAVPFPSNLPGLTGKVVLGGGVYGLGLLAFNVMDARGQVRMLLKRRKR